MTLPIDSLLTSTPNYVQSTTGIHLRPYQLDPIPNLLDSIQKHRGDSIVIVFPRQSGKDEFLIHLMAYLLDLYSKFPVGIVAVNPTYKPQTINALLRFDQLLNKNPLTAGRWRKHGGFMRLINLARISFLSGNLSSNVVGATASLLLIINEAQDISPALYQRKFLPMVASTQATCLFAGTLWTSSTLLSQEIRHARYAQEQDGRQRLFMVDADHVRRVLPNYGAHVDSVIARWGRQHPLVKTQYFNEEIDASSSMFNSARLALIFSGSPLKTPPKIGDFGGSWRGADESGENHRGVTFLIDLAGQDEAVMADPASRLANPTRDSAALSIAEVDTSTVSTLNYPTYRILHRVEWTGQNHLTVFGQLKSLAESWNPLYIVMDATGVGEGLWALLDKSFPGKVIPVKFTSATKSEIGYRFLAIIDTGRFRDCSSTPEVEIQYRTCQSEVLPGPTKTLRWGVPEGKRDSDGTLIHDDFLLADSLVTQLDTLDWSFHSPTIIIYPNTVGSLGLNFRDNDIQPTLGDNTDLLDFMDHNY